MKQCQYYQRHIDTEPDKISDMCQQRGGVYQDDEIAAHFWKDRQRRNVSCKHCLNKERNALEKTGPVLTKDWPRDANGRWLNYWHLIEKDVILTEKE
jgi:hypothetical protein